MACQPCWTYQSEIQRKKRRKNDRNGSLIHSSKSTCNQTVNKLDYIWLNKLSKRQFHIKFYSGKTESGVRVSDAE